MLKGQLLYKDIINIYSPLSYQINAFLYFVFGQNLNTLYFAGLMNSLLILASFYLISRLLVTVFMSFSLTFFVMSVCVFNYYIFNFVFPYTYAAVYALGSFLLALLFACYYLKFSNKVFIFLSFFFMGFSIACKYEYTLFTAVLILTALFVKKLNFKELLISAGLFLSVPAISLSVLFLQGVSVSDLLKAVELVKNICSSSTLKYFYTFSGYFYNPKYIELTFNSFITAFLLSIIPFSLFYLAVCKTGKIQTLIIEKKPAWLLYVVSYFVIVLITFVKFVTYGFAENFFAWLPITTSAILIFLTADFFKKGFKNAEIKRLLYFLITLGAFIASLKSYFLLNTHTYGTFIFPLTLLVNLIFVIDYLPNSLNFENTNYWKKTWALYIIFLSVVYSTVYIYMARNVYNTKVKTENGTVYATKDTGKAVNELIKYVDANAPANKRFLMMPEGVILNFLTGRDSDNKYYSLLPLNIETFGENNIINDLKKNPPDYIFINNRNTNDYGYDHICNDYAKNLCGYIVKNYDFKKIIGSEFIIKIYKLRQEGKVVKPELYKRKG